MIIERKKNTRNVYVGPVYILNCIHRTRDDNIIWVPNNIPFKVVGDLGWTVQACTYKYLGRIVVGSVPSSD